MADALHVFRVALTPALELLTSTTLAALACTALALARHGNVARQ